MRLDRGSEALSIDAWLAPPDGKPAPVRIEPDAPFNIIYEMIISGGFSIYPSDLEAVLFQHPAVRDTAVVGLASRAWRETPVGFVVLRLGVSVSGQDITVANGATTDQTLTYSYDSGTYGKGRLTGVFDSNHSLSWLYDDQGRVLTTGQMVGSVSKSTSYTYVNGQRQTMTTPSGQVLTYAYTNGKITSISVNGTVLVNNILYDPFGPVRQWTWGNGSLSVRTFDTGSMAFCGRPWWCDDLSAKVLDARRCGSNSASARCAGVSCGLAKETSLAEWSLPGVGPCGRGIVVLGIARSVTFSFLPARRIRSAASWALAGS